MKLSEAIEQAIVSGTYNQCCEYMCVTLRKMNMEHHVQAVQQMVNNINPRAYDDQPLICALHDAGILDMGIMTQAEQFTYNQQLYCWWVFDLKRKGL